MKTLLLPFILLMISTPSIANEIFSDSANHLSEIKAEPLSLSIARLPIDTYIELSNTFSTLYEKTNFTPNICNSYFNQSDLSNMVAVPLMITPGESFYFEVFGQLYDPQYHYLSNMGTDTMMYGFHYQSAISQKNLSNIAMGFGLSVKLDENVDLKTLFSNREIPGYGRNNLALGIEVAF